MDRRFFEGDSGRVIVKERWIEARGRKYGDGGWKGVLVTPTRRGTVALAIELDPRDVKAAREAVRSTHALLTQNARAHAAHVRDVVGSLDIVGDYYTAPDIVGDLTSTVYQRVIAPPVRSCMQQLAPSVPSHNAPIAWGTCDVVGDLAGLLGPLQVQFAGAQQRAGTAIQTGAASQGALAGALSGAQSGGVAGAAAGAGRGLVDSTGLGDLGRAFASGIYESWLGGATQGAPTSLADLQARRNSAIRDLYAVAGEPSHAHGVRNTAFGMTNWEGAVSWNTRNLGIQGATPGGDRLPEPGAAKQYDPNAATYEQARLIAARTTDERRALLSRLDPRSPYLNDAGATVLPPGVLRPLLATPRTREEIAAGYPWPWPGGGSSATQALVDILLAAQRAGTAPPAMLQSIPATRAPGVATSALSAPVSDVGASLGASEALSRARSLALPEAALVVSKALRAVDAAAAANLGDPRARAVIRRAINDEARSTRQALSIAQALLGLR